MPACKVCGHWLSKSNHKKNSVKNVSLYYTDCRAMLPRCGMGIGKLIQIDPIH